jgi:hypothetical protein
VSVIAVSVEPVAGMNSDARSRLAANWSPPAVGGAGIVSDGTPWMSTLTAGAKFLATGVWDLVKTGGNVKRAAAGIGERVERALQGRSIVSDAVADRVKIREIENAILCVSGGRTENHDRQQCK